jgi:hypothetical protein
MGDLSFWNYFLVVVVWVLTGKLLGILEVLVVDI